MKSFHSRKTSIPDTQKPVTRSFGSVCDIATAVDSLTMVRQQNIDTFDSEGENGGLVIDETQAQVVRRTDADFRAGLTPSQIAWDLTGDSIPTPMGKNFWLISTINLILRNEKYKGNALLQKTVTTDFLTKIVKKNESEVPQYYVTGHHEPILETTVLNTESLQAQQTTLTKELEESIVLIDQLIETAKRMLSPTPVSTFRGPVVGQC